MTGSAIDLAAHLDGCEVVAIENVPSYCGKNIPSSRSFQLGKSCGQCETVAELSGANVLLFRPQEWQGALELKRGDSTPAEFKRMMRERATELTGVKATLKTADALLILVALLKLYGGAVNGARRDSATLFVEP